ncbi:MAG: NADH-quinone oxidoreductase subunit C [Patescibacteria group bacterium]|jgi:Ni,Fe-hydrogenase III large subunit/Ni,Fe-hydrogenase III component G
MEEKIKNLIGNENLQNFGNINIYEVSISNIMDVCKDLYHGRHLQLKTALAIDNGNGTFKIMYVFGIPKQNVFFVPYIELGDSTDFPSLANEIHEITNYERKIRTFFGLHPVGHIDPKPIILHENWPANQHPLRKNFAWDHRPPQADGTYEFAKIEGEGIYEIPVGPVHAGIIEPGHFRFSVAGEEIVNLEAKLGYVHKGSEKLFEILPLEQKIKLSEKISGDSAFSHSLAFCQAVEAISNTKIPEKAKWLRVIFAELERLSNHFGDIGFMMLDTGFSFGGSNGTRLREMIMQINERITGSRFLRGTNAIGGVTKDISGSQGNDLAKDLEKIKKDFAEIIEIANDTSSLQNRLEKTGTLDPEIAVDHGVVGVAGRALGIEKDARIEYPYAAYAKVPFKIAIEETGDVNARFKIRVKEANASIGIILHALENLTETGDICASGNINLAKDSYSIGIVEGWRGEIVYFIATDSKGGISRVEVRDPSFLNWTVLGYAGKTNIVPDFPLINKSFNLSYSGNDL